MHKTKYKYQNVYPGSIYTLQLGYLNGISANHLSICAKNWLYINVIEDATSYVDTIDGVANTNIEMFWRKPKLYQWYLI